MAVCEICGQQVDFPFRCNYCGSLFCAEHRLPENHKCPNLPKEAPYHVRVRRERPYTTPRRSRPVDFTNSGEHKNDFNTAQEKQPNENQVTPNYSNKKYEPKKSNKRAILAALTAIILIAALVMLIFNNSAPSYSAPTSTFNPSSSTPSTLTPTQTPNPTPTIDTHKELVNYALSLINTDRQANGLQSVTLSSINSGQVHAEEMLKNGYFSHWDMNGQKPYMRYTLAGGKGSVSENCAWKRTTADNLEINSLNNFIKSALSDLEYSMMYDDASSNWGHKDNILNPLHNKVSIGISYDNHNVYLVQDFENDYISWSQLNVNNNQVTMQGTIQRQQSNIQQIAVFYDNPSSLTVNQLEQAPYQDGYDAGTDVATVVPPAPQGQYYDWTGISIKGIEVDSWNQNGNSFQISFSLSSVIATQGKGIYTIYLLTGSSTATSLTTYSIWVDTPALP